MRCLHLTPSLNDLHSFEYVVHPLADDGWANATSTPDAGASGISSTVSGATNTATAVAASAAGVAVGAAQYAYGHAMGDEQTKLAGKEAVWGKQ